MEEGAFNGKDKRIGYFVLSLDTELAWGIYDHFAPGLLSPDGSRERRAIDRLLEILDEFNVVATWGVVGHLFYSKCERCSVCPVLDWQGKFGSFEAVYGTASPLWYGADVIQGLLSKGSRHEIAFHGYTHRVFDERTMTADEAIVEVVEWQRAAVATKIIPTTVVFPRNRVGHLQVFKECGFTCYRADELLPGSYYTVPFFGKALNALDLILQVRRPEVYELPAAHDGLVGLPASRSLLRKPRRFDQWLHWMNLEEAHLKSIVRGVERAASQRRVLHIFSHPCEFQSEGDFQKLRRVLQAVAAQVAAQRLESISMRDLARIACLHDARSASMEPPNNTERQPA